MVIDALDAPTADETWRSLAALMNLKEAHTEETRRFIAEHTLVRKLEGSSFDPDRVPWNRKVTLQPVNGATCFDIARQHLPEHVPGGWNVTALDAKTVRVTVESDCEIFVQDGRTLEVNAAGQLPTGFDPQALYPARSHPRGLQMTIFAASDALGNLGLAWSTLADRIPADQISVYAGSAMSQMDPHGNGGLLMSRHQGRRVTSKQVSLGLAEMPADFVNAYVLGNLGTTGHNMGACATFLYNLRQGIHDIQSGRSRIVLVGGAESPLVPEVIDGLTTMGALGRDEALLALDKAKGTTHPDYRRACRPFADNCGFTVGEGAQFVVLMDDELALELGADIHAVIADVYVNADGYKKSISSPGVGNYITFAKAVSLGRQILGERAVRHRSFIQAHGTGTPQNRVTESCIFNETAKAFGIHDWPVAAIKCYVGHTMAVASGDQLIATLGVWRYGIIPGIATIDAVADDVHASHLHIALDHLPHPVDQLDVAFLNAKGFGGNNATATVLAPHIAAQLLEQKHGANTMAQWRDKAEKTRARAAAYDRTATEGLAEIIYHFDHNVRGDTHIHMTMQELRVDGYAQPIRLDVDNPLGVQLELP
jgi:acetoacetyl-[acyl-carrier protein] synthase